MIQSCIIRFEHLLMGDVPRVNGKYIGICGQGPSDHPDFARWLMEQGIEAISLNPDTVVQTWLDLSRATGH